ncbi:MAG: hypothetical protein RBS36_12640 [Thiomicrospira sp.]|jgi:hypothetical protein|nr:hypothetical protein [Thiomicrospira sp.]
MAEQLITYDESSNLMASLKMLESSLSAIKVNPLNEYPENLKPLILGLHGSLEAIMLNALTSMGSTLGAFHRDQFEKEIAFKKGEEGGCSATQVDVITNYYKRLKSPEWTCHYIDSQPLAESNKHESAIKRLQELRNDLVHFAPKSLTLTMHEINDLTISILDLLFQVIEKTNLVSLGAKENEVLSKIKQYLVEFR